MRDTDPFQRPSSPSTFTSEKVGPLSSDQLRELYQSQNTANRLAKAALDLPIRSPRTEPLPRSMQIQQGVTAPQRPAEPEPEKTQVIQQPKPEQKGINILWPTLVLAGIFASGGLIAGEVSKRTANSQASEQSRHKGAMEMAKERIDDLNMNPRKIHPFARCSADNANDISITGSSLSSKEIFLACTQELNWPRE